MEISYIVKFETRTIDLDPYNDDPLIVCVESVRATEDFCSLFGFELSVKTDFWGDVNPSFNFIRKGGVRFMIGREITLSEIAIMTMAVQSFMLYKKFIITDESIRLFEKCPKK